MANDTPPPSILKTAQRTNALPEEDVQRTIKESKFAPLQSDFLSATDAEALKQHYRTMKGDKTAELPTIYTASKELIGSLIPEGKQRLSANAVLITGKDKDGKTTDYLIVNQEKLQWTEATARKFALSDAMMADDVKSGALIKVTKDTVFKNDKGDQAIDWKRLNEAAGAPVFKSAGLKDMPDIYILPATNKSLGQASTRAGQTREGHNFVIIPEKMLRRMNSEQVTGVTSHEFAHTAHDVSLAYRAAEHNRELANQPNETDRQKEVRADKEGALATCDPKALREALAIAEKLDKDEYKLYLKDHPEAKSVKLPAGVKLDPDYHPSQDVRATYLGKMEKDIKDKGCPAH